MTAIRSSAFLRRVLTVDAVFSGVSGIAMIAFAELFANLLQLPVELVSEAGIVLLPFAAFVGFIASRSEPARFAVWIVIALNAVWVVDSVVLLFTGWVAPNVLGYAVVLAQAAGVLVLADLEYMGLKRSAVAA
ncbi:MAG TPA: hypothetical protein VH814_15150 [Steroidobacteraceae bacterium]